MPYQAGRARLKDSRRPRIYLTPGNVDALRRKRRRAPFAAMFEQMVDQARTWAETDLPEEPRNFPEPCTFRYGDAFDGEILGEITTRTQSMVRPAILTNGFLYQMTGQERYAAETRRWLLHACNWDVEGSTGVWGNDIQAALMGMAMACGYDWIHPTLDARDRRRVRTNLAARARQMFTFLTPVEEIYNGAYCNHAWMDASCAILSGIAVFDEVPDAPKWIDRMVALFQRDFLTKGYADGSWHELSFYWKTAFLYGVCFAADPLRDCFGIDLYQQPWLRNGGEYAITAVANRPDLRLAFGDAAPVPDWQEFLALEKWADEYGRPEARWCYAGYRDQPRMLQGFPFSYLWVRSDPAAGTVVPTWRPKRRFQSGEVFLRGGWGEDAVTVAFRAGPYVGHTGYSHSHGDQNSFMLHAYGERLLIDGGIYDYWGSEHYSRYYTTSMAHNTVLVQGQGQRAMTQACRGEILDFITGESIDYLCAEAAGAYGNPHLRSFVRELWFVEDEHLILRDRLRADEPLEFTWLFHSLAPLAQAGHRAVVHAGKAGAVLHFITTEHLDADLTTGFPVAPTTMPSPDYQEHHLALTAPASVKVELITVIVPFRFPVDPDEIRVRDAEEAGHRSADETVRSHGSALPPPPVTVSVPWRDEGTRQQFSP